MKVGESFLLIVEADLLFEKIDKSGLIYSNHLVLKISDKPLARYIF